MKGKLETLLCKIHQRSYCHLVGNATTGLTLALKALGLKGKNVAIPNNVCPHVPLAVYLSGNKPVYIDISQINFGIDLNDLLKKNAQIHGIIAVHAYGSVCNIDELYAFSKASGIPLVEDLAMAQGARQNGQPAGSFANIAVISFGKGKIINAGHGGAVLTNSRNIHNHLCTLNQYLKPQTISSQKKIVFLNKFHTKLYNANLEIHKNINYVNFRKPALSLSENFLFSFNKKKEAQIIWLLENIEKNISQRRKNAQIFKQLLSKYESKKLQLGRLTEECVPWRFNILVEQRNKLLKSFLNQKWKISSWYPSVDLFFETRKKSNVHTPISDFVGNRILNIFVDDSINLYYIRKTILKIKKHIDSF